MELLVIAILFSLTGAHDSQLEGPENTASVVGSTVTLKCSSPSRNCYGIDWQKYIPGASPITIFKGPGTILNVVDRDRYSVDNSSACDLVIRNVQLKDAGRFVCSAIISSSQVTKTAHLIILATQPKCTINAFEGSSVAGDRMQLTCEVTYNGTINASMVWKGVEDAPVAVKVGNTISRQYSIIASAPEVPSFTCTTSFAFETHENGMPIGGLASSNIPNAICATSAIKVLYSVSNVTLSPSLSNYPPGTVIICEAMGHPLPTIKWQEMENCGAWRNIQDQFGSQFTMTNASSKRYRCLATNVVRGKTFDREIQPKRTEFKDDLSPTRPIVSEDRLGIGIGIGLLAAMLLATVAFAILVRLRFLKFHTRPVNESPAVIVSSLADGVAQHQDYETSHSYLQPSEVNCPVLGAESPLVEEEEPAYTYIMREERRVSECAPSNQRQTLV